MLAGRACEPCQRAIQAGLAVGPADGGAMCPAIIYKSAAGQRMCAPGAAMLGDTLSSSSFEVLGTPIEETA